MLISIEVMQKTYACLNHDSSPDALYTLVSHKFYFLGENTRSVILHIEIWKTNSKREAYFVEISTTIFSINVLCSLKKVHYGACSSYDRQNCQSDISSNTLCALINKTVITVQSNVHNVCSCLTRNPRWRNLESLQSVKSNA